MTISSTVGRNNYDGDAAETEFAITFEFKATADIAVWTFDTSTSVEAKLASGFTIAGTAKADGTGFLSGLVTFTTAPSATTEISLINEPALTQPQDFTTGGNFPEVDIEGAYDRLALLIQKNAEKLARSVLFRTSSLLTDFEIPDPVADQILGWNATATALINIANAGATGGSTTVAVSSNDSTPGFLNGKLVAGTNVAFVEGNDGANETLTINVTATPASSSPFQVEETGAAASIFRAYRSEVADSTSVALGQYEGHGKNQAGAQIEYARIAIRRSTNGHTTGAEDGEIRMHTRRAGTMDTSPNRFRLANGLVIDDPSETTDLVDKGDGSINCREFFIENEPFESSAITPQLTAIDTTGTTSRLAMTTARLSTGYGVISNLLYVACGDDGGGTALATLEVYNITANTWATLTSADNARKQVASAIHNGKLYVFGGANTGNTAQTTTQEYTPTGDTWDDTLTALPAARRKCVAYADGDDIYIAGGISGGSARSSLYRYRPPGAVASPDTMVTLTSLPANRADGALVKLGDGHLYFFGGSSSTTSAGAVSTIYLYDIAADEWETLGVALPQPLVAPIIQVLSGYALIIGGEQPNRGHISEAWLFDPYEQRFLQLGSLSTVRSAAASGFNSDNDLIITGGFTTAVTDTTIRFGGSISQLSQGVGFRNSVLPADGLLLNISSALAGRNITVRLGDSWRILPFSDSVTTQNVAFIGDNVLNGNLLVESPAGVFTFRFGPSSTAGAQFDDNLGRWRTPGEVIETLAT